MPSTRSTGSSASTATRPRRRPGRPPRRADHRCRRRLEVRVTGSGGHTCRPHLTEDLTFALGQARHRAPAVLSRRLDPRAGRQRGVGPRPGGPGDQRDPRHRQPRRHGPDARRGRLERHGAADPHLRATRSWRRTASRRSSTTSAASRRSSTSPRPPRCSAAPWTPSSGPRAARRPRRASVARTSRGTSTRVPGAMGRLGTREPGGPTYDIHQGNLRVDERATCLGRASCSRRVAVGSLCHRRITLRTCRRASTRRGLRGLG